MDPKKDQPTGGAAHCIQLGTAAGKKKKKEEATCGRKIALAKALTSAVKNLCSKDGLDMSLWSRHHQCYLFRGESFESRGLDGRKTLNRNHRKEAREKKRWNRGPHPGRSSQGGACGSAIRHAKARAVPPSSFMWLEFSFSPDSIFGLTGPRLKKSQKKSLPAAGPIVAARPSGWRALCRFRKLSDALASPSLPVARADSFVRSPSRPRTEAFKRHSPGNIRRQ